MTLDPRLRIFSVVVFVLLCIACGDDSSLLNNENKFRFDMISLKNGEWLVRSSLSEELAAKKGYIFFRINGNSDRNTDLSLRIELYDQTAFPLAQFERIAPPVNVDIPLEIDSSFKEGLYRLVLTLSRRNQIIASERRDFFVVDQNIKLYGIQSFPVVIEPAEAILLIADLQEKPGLDPYLRWLDKGNTIAEGLLSDGYNQIFWEAPSKEGIFSVSVEVYPFPPSGASNFNFPAWLKSSAELFLKPKPTEEIGFNQKAYEGYNLFRLYLSTLKERERMRKQGRRFPQAVQPLPVINSQSLAVYLRGETIFYCPENLKKDKGLKSLNLELSFSLETEEYTNRKSIEISFADADSLNLFFNSEGELVLGLNVNKDKYLFNTGLKDFKIRQTNLLVFSVSELAGSIAVKVSCQGLATSFKDEQLKAIDNDELNSFQVKGKANGLNLVLDKMNLVFVKE